MPKNSNYCTFEFILPVSKILLNILQVRLQQYVNREFSNVQAGFRKGRGTRDQIASICWIIEKTRELKKKKSTSASWTMLVFNCVCHNKLWKILKEMGMPDHLTCLLRNLCVGQEAIVRTRCRKTDGFQIEKRERQGCTLSP